MSLEFYADKNGNCPFLDWFHNLRDVKTKARIESRMRRLDLGYLGDFKTIDQGVIELRLDFGPGYRLYVGRVDNSVVLLLCGGIKRTQRRDIERAIRYLADYKERS